jgi:hypothetical protein
MASSRNASKQPKQQTPGCAKTYRRSPYREPTHVVRIPESLLPKVRTMLDEMKSDVSDSAWLDR